MTLPRYFDIAFGTSGDLVAIPDPVQGDGSVSYTQGYPVGYSLPVSSGGRNIERAKMNQLFFDITSALKQYQERGTPDWYASIAAAAGYSKYDRVRYTDGKTYQSIVDANDVAPGSDVTKWYEEPLGQNNAFTTSSIAGANHTYASTDTTRLIFRSNSGSAMADALPTGGGALANGWFAYVKNSDTAPLVISGGTIKQGNLTGNVVIEPGETWLIISQGGDVYDAGRVHSAVLHASPAAGSFKNLVVQTTSNTATSITADELVLEDSNGNTRRMTNVNQANATGTAGAGGLDTGTIASNTWYSVWVIYNPVTNTVSSLLSTSQSAPTLPSGYTFKARVGYVRTDASGNLLRTLQYGRRAQYVVGTNPASTQVMASGANGSPSTPTWSPVATGNYVPPTAATILGTIGSGPASGTCTMIAAPNNSYGPYNSSSNPPPVAFNAATSSQGLVNIPFEFTLESSSIYWASASGSATLSCTGWTDNL